MPCNGKHQLSAEVRRFLDHADDEFVDREMLFLFSRRLRSEIDALVGKQEG
jgi:hypothetical protein